MVAEEMKPGTFYWWRDAVGVKSIIHRQPGDAIELNGRRQIPAMEMVPGFYTGYVPVDSWVEPYGNVCRIN